MDGPLSSRDRIPYNKKMTPINYSLCITQWATTHVHCLQLGPTNFWVDPVVFTVWASTNLAGPQLVSMTNFACGVRIGPLGIRQSGIAKWQRTSLQS